jgi:glycosyltransferase involved in cell wall biosynthesis
MRFLFLHQNFPGQYIHVARYLVALGHHVVAVSQDTGGESVGEYRLKYTAEPPNEGCHPYLSDLDGATQNGLAVLQSCKNLRSQGFTPDIVIGHGGWGETMFVKAVWPATPLLSYCEFFYRSSGSDIDFDPEFPPEADVEPRLRLRNACNLIALDAADWGQSPTRWQQGQFPAPYRPRISVIHEGVDTAVVKPDRTARLWLGAGLAFAAGDPVITYVARNLEPYRGFHVFMRALPEVLRRRPDAHVLVVGGDDVSYGRPPVDAVNWRGKLAGEMADGLDWSRVHFLGRLAHSQHLAVLKVSAVHVYMTYPFVLSWSLVEALASGCRVVASRTPPVEEVIEHGDNGRLVDFFDRGGLVEQILAGLDENAHDDPLRRAARETVLDRFDLNSVCLPAFTDLIQDLVGRKVTISG